MSYYLGKIRYVMSTNLFSIQESQGFRVFGFHSPQFLHFSSLVIYIITYVCPSLAVWRGRLNFLSLYLFGNELRDLLFHVLCQIGYPAEICCERSRNSSKSPSSLGPNSFSVFAKRTQSKKNGFAKDISTMGIW